MIKPSTAYLPLLATCALLSAAQVASAQTPDGELIHFKKGDTLSLHGLDYKAAHDGTGYVALSSEYLSVAVLSGRLKSGRSSADGGEILLTSIEGGKTQVFMFDAQALKQSISPEMAPEVSPLLAPIAKRQAHQRFFGMIEPVALNAQTPAPPAAETMRRRYLSSDVIVALRREAAGDPAKLSDLTARRFVDALAASDAVSVAALIDPKPYTDASSDPNVWLKARSDFAGRLIAQPGLVTSLAGAPISPESQTTWRVGESLRVRTVTRDRAAFVAGLEPIQ